MKKIMCLILIVVLFSLPFFNFSFVSANALDEDIVLKQEIGDILTDFLINNPNRYHFSINEQKAASYIVSKLKEFGYLDNQISIDEFSEEIELESATIFKEAVRETFYSQNIILRIDSGNENAKRIVIACNYDNIYTEDNKNEGALDNASAVSATLAIAKKLSLSTSLNYDLDICFFGAGYYNYTSSDKYIDKYGLADVLAMFNLYRIGGENTYIYCDEIKTEMESYLLNKGEFLSVPNSIPLIDGQLLKNYPYTHYAMIGSHSAFLERGVPIANIFGAYYKPLSLIDYEGTKDILDKDTLENLVISYPDSFEKIAQSANLVLSAIKDADFESVVLRGKSATDSILMQKWIAYLIFIFIAICSFAGFYFTGRHLIKKYPLKMRRARLAVFGTEYENKGEIFIEPNNSNSSKHPFDDF